MAVVVFPTPPFWLLITKTVTRSLLSHVKHRLRGVAEDVTEMG